MKQSTPSLKSRILSLGVVPACVCILWCFDARFGGVQTAAHVLGFIDAVGDSSPKPKVPADTDIIVFGWAADSDNGAPVSRVDVYIDGTLEGEATLGITRSDVTDTLRRQDYARSGWSLRIPASSLIPGTHFVAATATGPSGSVELPGGRAFAVTSGRAERRPSSTEPGNIDQAGGVAGGSVLPSGATLQVAGWAADIASGSPVTRVTIRVDNMTMGTAKLGAEREDVARFYHRDDFLRSGWSFSAALPDLPPGAHLITAVASGPSGSALLPGSRTITLSHSK